MNAVLAFLKFLFRHKEKIILGIMLIAFAAVAYTQWEIIKERNSSSQDDEGENPNDTPEDDKPVPPARKPESFRVPRLINKYGKDTYVELVTARDIFKEPEKKKRGSEPEKPKEWAEVNVKSVFDPTRAGSYIAIIEVDKRRRFVKEGEQFDEYTVKRIDGVRNCLTIERRGEGEREFCKEE